MFSVDKKSLCSLVPLTCTHLHIWVWSKKPGNAFWTKPTPTRRSNNPQKLPRNAIEAILASELSCLFLSNKQFSSCKKYKENRVWTNSPGNVLWTKPTRIRRSNNPQKLGRNANGVILACELRCLFFTNKQFSSNKHTHTKHRIRLKTHHIVIFRV